MTEPTNESASPSTPASTSEAARGRVNGRRPRRFYIGSFTTDGARGRGISVTAQDPETGELTAPTTVAEGASPAYLAWHPSDKRLYATNETAEATVTAYSTEPVGGTRGTNGALQALGAEPTGGAGACHLSVHPSGNFVLTANYGSGSVAVHPIRDDGTLGDRTDLVQHTGSGPNPARQEGPHAHQVRITPDGAWVLVNDLGLDAVFTYTLDTEHGTLRPGPVPQARSTPGAGPRHLVFHPDGRHVLVAAELTSQVLTFGYDAEHGALDLLGTAPSTYEPLTAEETNYPSEIALSEDGRFCYVANRGRDTIGVLEVSGATLRPVAEVSTGGAWPRHLVVVGRFLYVANQNSDTVTHFRLDAETGVPEQVSSIVVPSASCILPEPQ